MGQALKRDQQIVRRDFASTVGRSATIRKAITWLLFFLAWPLLILDGSAIFIAATWMPPPGAMTSNTTTRADEGRSDLQFPEQDNGGYFPQCGDQIVAKIGVVQVVHQLRVAGRSRGAVKPAVAIAIRMRIGSAVSGTMTEAKQPKAHDELCQVPATALICE